MNPADPPLASPGHPTPAPGDSGVRQLTEREYRIRMDELQAKIDRDKAEAAGRAKADALIKRIWTVGGAVVVIILGTLGTSAWTQGKVDAGTAPVKEELAEHKKVEAEAIHQLDRKIDEIKIDAKTDRERQDKRWEAVLWKLNVRDPAPAPPPSKDGGR